MDAAKKTKLKTIAYWITMFFGPASFVIGGYVNLTSGEQPLAMLTHLGYPLYLARIIGFWKLAGAIVCVLPGLPRMKEWAYAGFAFLLSGAVASHLFVGDPMVANDPYQIAPALFCLAMVLINWSLRPDNRKLPSRH